MHVLQKPGQGKIEPEIVQLKQVEDALAEHVQQQRQQQRDHGQQRIAHADQPPPEPRAGLLCAGDVVQPAEDAVQATRGRPEHHHDADGQNGGRAPGVEIVGQVVEKGPERFRHQQLDKGQKIRLRHGDVLQHGQQQDRKRKQRQQQKVGCVSRAGRDIQSGHLGNDPLYWLGKLHGTPRTQNLRHSPAGRSIFPRVYLRTPNVTGSEEFLR